MLLVAAVAAAYIEVAESSCRLDEDNRSRTQEGQAKGIGRPCVAYKDVTRSSWSDGNEVPKELSSTWLEGA